MWGGRPLCRILAERPRAGPREELEDWLFSGQGHGHDLRVQPDSLPTGGSLTDRRAQVGTGCSRILGLARGHGFRAPS